MHWLTNGPMSDRVGVQALPPRDEGARRVPTLPPRDGLAREPFRPIEHPVHLARTVGSAWGDPGARQTPRRARCREATPARDRPILRIDTRAVHPYVRGRPAAGVAKYPPGKEVNPTMTTLHALISRFFARDEEGQGLAEYALILALIAIVAIIALIFLGGQVSKILSTVGNSV